MIEAKFCKTCGKLCPAERFEKFEAGRVRIRPHCYACRMEAKNRWQARKTAKTATPKRFKYRDQPWAAYMLSALRSRAKKKGFEFDLAAEDLVMPDVCPVLGIRLLKRFEERTGPFDFKVRDQCPSVDRIDNSKGYVKGNVIIVSNRANRLKNDATMAELEAIAGFYKNLGVK